MRCREALAALPEYMEEALPPAKHAQLVAHLAECGECRRERAAHERAARALSAAGMAPAPDLWQSFQARLNAEAPIASCEQVRNALPEWIDGDSTSVAPRLVADHLERCRTCAAEERRLVAALGQIERVGRAGALAAPDLWPAFSAKLAATISCAALGDRLPAHLAGERSPDALAIEQHLAHCRHCAAAATDYTTALGALDRAGRTQMEPDLWASMAARVADEQRARSDGGLARLQALARRQAWLPAVSGAVLVAAAVVVAAFVFRGQEQPAMRTMARVPEAETTPVAPAQPVDGTLPAAAEMHPAAGGTRHAKNVAPRRRPRWTRRAVMARRRDAVRPPLRLANAELSRTTHGTLAPPVIASHERPDWSRKLEVTFDVKQPGVRVASALTTETATGPEEMKIEAEVIHAAKMLVSIDDAATRPFEMKADGN